MLTTDEQSSPRTPHGDSARICSAARKAVPVLREFAGQADEESRLPGESADALANAGMFRLAVPATLGGHEASVRTCLEATAALAHGCAAASWITAISYGAQQIAASFGERVRSELWGDTPDVPLCGSFNPATVTVTRADGGQVVNGPQTPVPVQSTRGAWPRASNAGAQTDRSGRQKLQQIVRRGSTSSVRYRRAMTARFTARCPVSSEASCRAGSPCCDHQRWCRRR